MDWKLDGMLGWWESQIYLCSVIILLYVCPSAHLAAELYHPLIPSGDVLLGLAGGVPRVNRNGLNVWRGKCGGDVRRTIVEDGEAQMWSSTIVIEVWE